MSPLNHKQDCATGGLKLHHPEATMAACDWIKLSGVRWRGAAWFGGMASQPLMHHGSYWARPRTGITLACWQCWQWVIHLILSTSVKQWWRSIALIKNMN